MSFAVYAVSVTAILKKNPCKTAILRAWTSLSETAVGRGPLRGSPRAARRDGSRSSGSSIAAAQRARPAASSGGVGASGGCGRRSSAGAGLGDGPGREPERRRRRVADQRAASCRGSSSASRPSSKAQVEDAVATWSVPSRPMRSGHACARDRRAHRVGPGRGSPPRARPRPAPRRRGARARTAPPSRSISRPAPPGRRPRAAAPARAEAPRRPSR